MTVNDLFSAMVSGKFIVVGGVEVKVTSVELEDGSGKNFCFGGWSPNKSIGSVKGFISFRNPAPKGYVEGRTFRFHF